MNNNVYLIASNVWFPDDEGAVSAAHADLHDGVLVETEGRYKFSYNAFNPPAICFTRDGIVIHNCVYDLIAPTLGNRFVVEPCPNDKVMYLPVFKNIHVHITQSMDDGISKLGIFEYFMRKNRIRGAPDQYQFLCAESLEKNLTIRNTKPLPFGESTRMNTVSVSIPENIREVELWRYKGVWILNQRLYELIHQFIDTDYYTVLEIYEVDLWA